MARKELAILIAVPMLLGILTPFSSAAADEPAQAAESPPAPRPAEIASWIAELDADQYLVREKASQRLFEAGESAVDALLEAANSDRPEPAERAAWILRRLGRSHDDKLAIAALERLVQLRGRPQLVERAEIELARLSVKACKGRLEALGAEVVASEDQILLSGNVVVVAPMVHVRLAEKWRGKTDDLRCLADLRSQRYFRLEGQPIDDAVVALFQPKEKLTYLQLFNTRVTAEAVDALKARHPDAVVYMKNQALLGVSAENHAAGVFVLHVQPGTAAAAAGIVVGDIVASIEGRPLPDFDRLTARIAQHQPGDKIEVEVIRGDQRLKLPVTLGRWPPQG